MAVDAQDSQKQLDNVKKEPVTPKPTENGERESSSSTGGFRGRGSAGFRGRGRGDNQGFRGNRGGDADTGNDTGSTPSGGFRGRSNDEESGIKGRLGHRGGSRGGRGGYGGHRGGGRGGPGSANDQNERSERPERGRGRGRGRGDRGSGERGSYSAQDGKFPPQDRIYEKLKALQGPQVDLQPREETTRKFSNHCRLWIGNLPLDIGEDDVRELFKPYGEFDEVYFDKNKGFAFVRMDYKMNAEKARQELHLKEYKGRQLKIRFSSPGTALKVRNLSTWVTNELLERSFAVFGELEKAVVITDERGRATGDGLVEYCKKPCATLALRKCQEGCFFLTSSPRPVIVEQMAVVDDNEGMGEMNVNKRNPEYMKERQSGPRFANPGSFEFEYGLKWKQLYELFDKKKEMLSKELADEKAKLEEQIEYAKYQHETELLKEQLRHREEINKRQQADFEVRQREWDDHRRSEEVRQQRIEEELSVKFRQQEEELRRRQEENRQFMQERASGMVKSENSQDGIGGGAGYQGTEGGSWRRNTESYGSQTGGSSWRGGGGSSENWGARGGTTGSRGGSTGQAWGENNTWDNRQDPWQSEESVTGDRASYGTHGDGDLPPPPDPHTFLESFNRGRSFEQTGSDYRTRDASRSRWGRNDRDEYGPAKRARY